MSLSLDLPMDYLIDVQNMIEEDLFSMERSQNPDDN